MWDLIARAVVLLITLPIHEYAHARTAVRLGDDTPRLQGRLSLNPFRHLDLFGSMALLLVGFGWAKPVQVDTRQFRHPRRDMAITALAGPMANVGIALIALIALKLAAYTAPAYTVITAVLEVLFLIIRINIQLAVFNLIPIPPLDGSKILGVLLPEKLYYIMLRYERVVMLLLLVLLWFNVLDMPISLLSNLLMNLLQFITRPIDMLLGF